MQVKSLKFSDLPGHPGLYKILLQFGAIWLNLVKFTATSSQSWTRILVWISQFRIQLRRNLQRKEHKAPSPTLRALSTHNTHSFYYSYIHSYHTFTQIIWLSRILSSWARTISQSEEEFLRIKAPALPTLVPLVQHSFRRSNAKMEILAEAADQ